jgi:MSHA pilin protein MshD
MFSRARSRGLSLIELVFFIVVLAIGFAATLVLYNQAVTGSVDPIVRKQVLAIANSLLEEIELRGFTYCDPDDANVYTATSATVGGVGGCATIAESAMGPDAGETTRALFDNVNDYHGFKMPDPPKLIFSIQDVMGNTIQGLGGYAVTNVTVAPVGAATFGLVDDNDALLITVTVTGPTNVSVTLHGYRFRYAPNSP